MVYNILNPGVLLIVLSVILRLSALSYRAYFALAFVSLVYLFFCIMLNRWSFFWFDQFLLSDEQAMFIVISLLFLALFVVVFICAFEKNNEDLKNLPRLFVYVGATISVLFTSHLLFILLFLELATIMVTLILFYSKRGCFRECWTDLLKISHAWWNVVLGRNYAALYQIPDVSVLQL